MSGQSVEMAVIVRSPKNLVISHWEICESLDMYDPTVGTFISEDLIGFGGGDANLHRYVGNSPTNATDPTGLAEALVDAGYKGIHFFLEWLPDCGTGELAVFNKAGQELAKLKYIVNKETGEGVVHVVGKHGKVLPGIAGSTLKKIAPKMTAQLLKVVARTGGVFAARAGASAVAATETSTVVERGVWKRVVSGAGYCFTVITVFVEVVFGAGASTSRAEEIPRPERFTLTPGELGLSPAELEGLLKEIRTSE